MSGPDETRVLFWVQHLLGIGHVRRAALLAQAMTARGWHVTVAQGGFPVAGIDWGGATVAPLAPARVADASFRPVLNQDGRPIDEAWRAHRAAALAALYRRVRPDILLVETFPFGRRPFRFELTPLLDVARAQDRRPVIACSVRDILVRKDDPAKERAMATAARRWFDRVLVHTDPAVLPFKASFPFAGQIADLVAETGYVAPPRRAATADGSGDGDGRNEIVVSVGGGAVGDMLLTAAVAAAARCPADWRWRLLVGPDLAPATLRDLAGQAGDNVIVESARADFPDLLARCRLSVSQAGYNTVMDILAAGCRALLVPFGRGAETEQPLRARLLAERGWADTLDEAMLTPDSLASAVRAALDRPPPGRARHLAIDGAAASAAILASDLTTIRRQ